ncbi:MAG: hypothetical protein K2W99_07225 [Chthoniobacterales bacterium]|nr:hypothetical protein [Chthoniobacterales bacterium]
MRLEKKVKQLLLLFFLNSLIFAAALEGTEPTLPFHSCDSKEDIQKIICFLTSDVDQAGVTYMGTAGALSGLPLPLSYYCTADYWSQYAENLYVPKGGLDPTQARDQMKLDSVSEQVLERVNIHSGCNIYDAATWQIALSLAAVHDYVVDANGENLFSLARNENKLLAAGYDGNSSEISLGKNRATYNTEGKFCYNEHIINDVSQAYYFRQVPRSYENSDPLNESPTPVPWRDWNPITGENAWAFLLGPLHAALLESQSTKKPVSFDSPAIQSALSMLPTFQKMQSETGAIYYAPASLVQNNDPKKASITPYTVSIENNISALAGLLVFKKVLTLLTQQQLSSTLLNDLEKKRNVGNIFTTVVNDIEKKRKIENALAIIKIMIHGGDCFCKEHKTHHTEGLLSFLINDAWDVHPLGLEHGEFFLSGEANNPTANKPWKSIRDLHPDTCELRAVDVNTWGLAVLGQPLIDKAHGFGAAYYLWENVKIWGAYQVNGELWGVGYSNRDLDGYGNVHPEDHTGILSAEWTAGAINMVRALITQYGNVITSNTPSEENQNKAREFVASLQKDHDSMAQHLQSLRTDQYPGETQFDSVRPQDYSSLVFIPTTKLAYLYASKRYLLPFHWYANPLPSTVSTSWAVMLHYNYNPFSMKGDYSPNFSEDGECLME